MRALLTALLLATSANAAENWTFSEGRAPITASACPARISINYSSGVYRTWRRFCYGS